VDHATGASVVKVSIDGGKVIDRDHGLVTASRTEERWTVDGADPLSAKGEIAWVKRMGRGEWQVRIVCDTRLEADADTWRWRARLRCWEGEDLAFEKAWESGCPRDQV
jgi:hypothetical protein